MDKNREERNRMKINVFSLRKIQKEKIKMIYSIKTIDFHNVKINYQNGTIKYSQRKKETW